MTVITDGYNRTNETPVAAPWTSYIPNTGGDGTVRWNLSGNVLVPDTLNTWDVDAIHSTVIGANQYAQVKVTTTGASGSGPGAGVSCRHSRTAPSSSIRAVADSDTVTVGVFSSGSFTATGTRSTTWAAGDILRLEVVDLSPNIILKVFKNGTQLGVDFTGVTGPNSGGVGVSYSSTASTASVDDFEGGDIAPPATNAPEKIRVITSGMIWQ